MSALARQRQLALAGLRRSQTRRARRPRCASRGQARLGGRRVERRELEIAQGEFAAILGPNGSGKTTLLRVLLGELALSRGTASVLGRPPGASKGQIGYLPQRRTFEAGTRIRGDRPRAARARRRALGPAAAPLRRWSASTRRSSWSARAGTRSDRSGAVGRRAATATDRPGAGQRARLLILDEPLDSLDLPNQSAVAALLERVCRNSG